MNASKMKNMIVIKDLPSNIIEEAYVVLKPHVKILKREEKEEKINDTSQGFIVKEAENILTNYFSNIEKEKNNRNGDIEKIKKKYTQLKKVCMGLFMILGANIFLQMIG